MESPFSKAPALVPILNHLRWLAALAVCIAHIRSLMFPDFQAFSGSNWAIKVFYLLTQFAVPAVTIFFVVSGLLVGGRVLRDVTADKFDVWQYVIDRAVRLYIVLIPAILLTLLTAFLSPSGCTPRDTAMTLAGNFLLLQNLFVEPLCNNHPLWSLSNEAAYYLMFPLLLVLWTRLRAPLYLFFVAGAVLFSTIAFATHADHTRISFGMLIWCAGLVPWFCRINLLPAIPLTAFLATLAMIRAHIISNDHVADLTLAASLACLLCCDRLRLPEGGMARAINHAGHKLAGFSYSLYLVHMPLGQFLVSTAGYSGDADPFSPRSYAVYAFGVGIIVAVGWLFGFLFERHTDLVRNMLRSHLRARAA